MSTPTPPPPTDSPEVNAFNAALWDHCTKVVPAVTSALREAGRPDLVDLLIASAADLASSWGDLLGMLEELDRLREAVRDLGLKLIDAEAGR